MMYGSHMGAGGWAFSIFATLIILGLLVAAIIWAVSQKSKRGGGSRELLSAHEILDRRLASDEITADQYDRLRNRLDASPMSSTP
jgi:uncharacterized membrane protein